MSIFRIYPVLARHCIFQNADRKLVEQYFTEDTLHRLCFEAREAIYLPGEKHRSVGLILSGTAEVHSDNGIEKSLVKTIPAGEMFGFANLYTDDVPFPSVIRAKERCEVLFLSGDAFRQFIEHDPAALSCYLEFLCGKIVYLNRKIAALTAGNAEKKLAFLILENEVNGVFEPTCSMTSLAETLGLGRASLYRALDSLEAMGMLRREGKRLCITDRDALSTFLGNSRTGSQAL